MGKRTGRSGSNPAQSRSRANMSSPQGASARRRNTRFGIKEWKTEVAAGSPCVQGRSIRQEDCHRRTRRHRRSAGRHHQDRSRAMNRILSLRSAFHLQRGRRRGAVVERATAAPCAVLPDVVSRCQDRRPLTPTSYAGVARRHHATCCRRRRGRCGYGGDCGGADGSRTGVQRQFFDVYGRVVLGSPVSSDCRSDNQMAHMEEGEK